MVAMAWPLLHVCIVYIRTYVWVCVLTVRVTCIHATRGKSLAVVMVQSLFVMCVYVCICVDCEDYLYPCHKGKKPGSGNGALSYVCVCMYLLTVRIICIHATRGRKAWQW